VERAPVSGDGPAAPSAHALVFAICHEVANLLAGTRLEASLIDPDGDGVSLVKTAARIESASARAGALLASIRPVLDPESQSLFAVDPADVLQGLYSGLDASVDARVVVDLESAVDLPARTLATEPVHFLLVSLVYCALAEAPSPACVRVSAGARGAELAFAVRCDGELGIEDASPALRGAPLALAVARRIVGAAAVGGRVEAACEEGGTRIELVFPGPGA